MYSIEYRTFRSVMWMPWIQTYNLEFTRFPGEPYDCLERLPHWVHQIMTHKVHDKMDDTGNAIPAPYMEYWLTRLASEYARDPVYYEALWTFAGHADTVTNSTSVPCAPSIWYDMSRTEIRTGLDYHKSKVLTFKDFCKMDEEDAVAWLNGDWKPMRNPDNDEHNSQRRLDLE